MRLVVVAVKDSAVGAFGRPLFVPSVGIALRSFGDEVNRDAPDNQMRIHSEDFELWYLCEFDESTGVFGYASPDQPGGMRCLARGKDVRRDE